MTNITPLFSNTYSVQSLRSHPLRVSFPLKSHIWVMTGRQSPVPDNHTIRIARYTGPEDAGILQSIVVTTAVNHFFDYQPSDERASHWYMNFADYYLFGAYGSSLMAQDEMQVFEHPLLGNIREYLLKAADRDERMLPYTRLNDGSPSPFTVKNVPRQIALDTSPTADNPGGLYGNRFASAPPEVVRTALTYLNPPTSSNIVCIEAPSGGRGTYTTETIFDILISACTGFAAVLAESGTPKVIIHTGKWGCGAYGGDIRLMLCCQILAARAAGIGELVFHGTVEEERASAEQLAGKVSESAASLSDAARILHEMNFTWGVSDGN